jgi:chromate transporter
MNKDSSLLAIALLFAPLSLMAVGGGISILGDLQREVVLHHGWLTQKEFLDTFAVSRVAPGPGTLIVTLIGWHVAGFAGALVASLAIFLPSSVLTYGVAHLWHMGKPALWQRAVIHGLIPIAGGLTLSSALLLLSHAEGGLVAVVASGVVVLLSWLTTLRPYWALGIGTVVYLLLIRLPLPL